jgi:hypothetical protein
MPGRSIAYVTTDDDYLATDPDTDLALVLPALAEVGVDATPEIWHDRSVDWARYDALIIRSPWDYTHRPAAWLAWLDARAATTPLLNCAHTIRWNLDKRYLLDLEAEGVAIVPTTVCDDEESVRAALDAVTDTGASAEVVVKPTVSAGSKDTGRFTADDPQALALGEHVLTKGKEVMVQPCIPGVAEVGERSVVYFDGELSHTLTKGPLLALGGGLIGGEYRETITATTVTDAEHELADAVARVVPSILRRNGCDCTSAVPLYARYDIVMGDDGPLLLEAKLFEPSFFLHTSPGSEHRFADAVARRVTGAHPL